MPEDIKILIADDHPVMRLGLSHLIKNEPNMQVVGIAANGTEAIRMAKESHPDLIILDIDMPEMDGLSLAHHLKAELPELKIVIFTAHHNEEAFNEAIDAGVEGFISKENVFDDLSEGIRQVAQGKNYFSSVFSDYLLNRIKHNDKTRKDRQSIAELLTSAEMRIMQLIADMKTSQEIADTLFISVKTVENHRTNICKKLNIKGKNGLLKFVLNNKHQFE
ncbi:response regulator transcription factor [Rhodoflexus caldus]|uniref:response regulator transcription factor n=1 Tax=Rhodoflexus caldus TaxID=2891236 RepID=UPI00202A2264|nr:response regulator transcription factor [Rhodoflexus caldus]